MRRLRAGALLLTALLLAAGCTGDDPAPAPAPTGGGQASVGPACPALGVQSTASTALPDLELPCLGAAGGGSPPLPLRRLTGTPTVLNLWATWCPPCRDELPTLARLHRAGTGKVRVLGVVTEDSAGAAVSYAADNGLPFPSLEDRDGELRRALRRAALPVTVLLTADGAVARVYQGRPLTDATLRDLVRDGLGVDVG